MKKLLTIILTSLIVLLLGIPVNAENCNASLIISSPGADASKEINISWHTDNNETFVRYALASDVNNSKIAVGECTPIPFDNKDGTMHCKATLTNLQSDTDYIYQVGKTGWSSQHTFKTAGSSNFSFVHVSDIHSYIQGSSNNRVIKANTLLNKAHSIEDDIRFALISGDAVAYGTVYEQWRDLFAMDTTEQMMYTLTPGNHDYYNTSAKFTNLGYFNAVTNHPDNGADGLKNATYYFKYGNTLFISLESEAAANSPSTRQIQRDWLKEVIAQNPSDFVIAFCHRPFYTGDGRNSGQAEDQREYFQAIFDECGVDLVLTGHNHVLARTHPVYDDNKTNSPDGTVYITASAVGDRHQTEEGTPMEAIDYYKIGAFDACTIVTVEENTIQLKTIDAGGNILDTYELLSKSADIDKFSYVNSLNVTSNTEDFSQATLTFDDIGPGRINQIIVTGEDESFYQVFNFPTTPFDITDIPGNIEYNLNVETKFRNGEKISKGFNLVNENKYFGSISNLMVLEINDYQNALSWRSDLIEGKITKFEIYVNSSFHKEVSPNDNQTLLNMVSPYERNEIEFRAIDFEDDIVFSETIIYGEDADPVEINFVNEIYDLEINDFYTPEIVITPQQNLLIEYTSSDESIATVDDNGKITAVSPGACTITASIAKRWSVYDTIEIIVNTPDSPEEPDDSDNEKEKKGCFGFASTTFVFTMGFILILLRRKSFK